jgi:hypothetical protein
MRIATNLERIQHHVEALEASVKKRRETAAALEKTLQEMIREGVLSLRQL